MLEYEEKASLMGYRAICGIDEAGRGPLAGPVVAAAVILPTGESPLQAMGLTDSKKLSDKKKDLLYDAICQEAVAYAIAEVHQEEIEELDILGATLKAMTLAKEGLSVESDFALIDGDKDKGQKYQINFPHQMIIKGDSLSLSIAAASVLAKVHRDRFMIEQDKLYPEYGFAGHKGYPTAKHYAKIKEHKLCPIHRPYFLKKRWEELGL